ncbi:hypothetical protein DEJ00_08450 [Curtobacterium sp. MCLR17_039]|nr:hypothetical protein DEJ00_08450 [Curtobacterium sp. MCLR17_039]
MYFNAIKDALAWTDDKEVRNVALTGSYGVGKSSILRQVAEDKSLKAIQVSLSTLGFEPAADASKRTGSDGKADGAENPLRDTKTNQIQKEIVKQLLYTQMPDRMPGSRYRRTAAFSWRREILIALASGIPLAIVIFLFGWTAKLATLFTIRPDWAIAANGGMAVVAAGLVLGVRFVTHNKLRIDSVSTGAATITLSAKTDTYFDEYLDEIVYFFQVVDADIVIFEDIDRFEDPHIFETLRELNTILNAAKQLNNRTIRFIYAIKDSIFEELGVRAAREAAGQQPEAKKPAADAAILEVARANRTKFFDLVIPVVPFVTHQSARQFMSDELKDIKGHKVSDALIDIVAQYVPDMRLIKNIRNEFAIFKEQVIRKSSLELDDDGLFAMVLYKSTHLSDFEQVKLGTSHLNTLYNESREIVAQQTAKLNSELLGLRRRLRNANDQAARADELGAAVEEYIALLIGHIGYPLTHIQYDGAAIPASDLHTAEFWQKYVDGSASLAFRFGNPYLGNPISVLEPDELERAAGYSLDPSKWDPVGKNELDEQIASLREDIGFYADADMSDLVKRESISVTVDGAEVLFAERVRSLLGSDLAADLIGGGYIDRYFTLYTSTFPGGKVSANAMNFVLKNVDTGSMDMFFKLTPDEAKGVIHERPRLAFAGRAAYNLDFVDYLLQDEPAPGTATVLRNLQRGTDDEKQFLQAFVASDHDATVLAGALAETWPRVLVVLVGEIEVEDGLRLALVDAALKRLEPSVEYAVNDSVRSYLLGNYGALSAFTGVGAKPEAIGKLMTTADFDMPDLSLLSAPIRTAIVRVGRFTVTRENLLAAIAPKVGTALDELRRDAPSVYKRMLASLNDYLGILVDEEHSIAAPDAFGDILSDIDRSDRKSLGAVVARSVLGCEIDDLTKVVQGSWPGLAQNGRFPSSFENVASYVEQYGVDAALAVVLSAGEISESEDHEEEVKLDLALQIARAGNVLPDPEIRAALIESLALEESIALESVPKERGDWIGRLIAHGVIKDSAASFALIASDDWVGLEFAISASSEVQSFIAPDIVSPSIMIRFLDSSVVPTSIKATVVSQFVDYSNGADRAVVNRMLRYALDNGVTLEWSAVERAARARADSSLVVRAVQPFINSVTLDDLRPVLTAMGGDYPKLLERNGKHPTVPNTPEHDALLNRLYDLGTVSTFTPQGATFKVNMGAKKR